MRCAPGGLSESHAPSRRPVLLPLGGLSQVEVGAAAGNGETLLLMSPKRREQLGTGEGGHGSSCAPRLCCLPGWSSAGAGGWSWGRAPAPGGHSPGSSHLPYSSVLVLQLGFVLSNFPSFIPRPCSAFRASRGILRPPALPSHKGSVTTPTRSILSPVWTGARTRLCRTSLLVTFGGREDACSKWWKERN